MRYADEAKRLFGADEGDVADCLNLIASVYDLQGRYDDALREHERALPIHQRVYGDNHEKVATSLNNIANVYYSRSEERRVGKECCR